MSNDSAHRDCEHEAAYLLPWFVSGTLIAQERVRVQAHLDDCSRCRADEVRERRLLEIVGSDAPVEYAPQPGLQKLLSRIEEMEREMPSAPPKKPVAASFAPRNALLVRWLAAAVIVQAVGLGALAWQHAQGDLFAPRFSTLSATPLHVEGAPRIRVVFAPNVTVGDLKTMLESVDAVVVNGPSEAGVYTLALASTQARIDAKLAQLRSEPGVLFAEPQL